MRGRLQSREGPARRERLQLGPSTGSILPFERRAGSHRAAGTYSSVNDQQCLAAVQALSGPRHGKTHWIVLPDPPFITSASPLARLPIGTYAVKVDRGSRLSKRTKSSGTSTIRAPIGSRSPVSTAAQSRPAT